MDYLGIKQADKPENKMKLTDNERKAAKELTERFTADASFLFLCRRTPTLRPDLYYGKDRENMMELRRLYRKATGREASK